MIDYLVGPEYRLTFCGKEHVLDGGLKTLKAIQHEFKKDVLDVLAELRDMSFEQHAKLIHIGITSDAPSLDVIEQAIIDEIGIVDVRWHLQAWLVISTTPKRDREKKTKEVTELLRKLTASVDSLGESTSSFA